MRRIGLPEVILILLILLVTMALVVVLLALAYPKTAQSILIEFKQSLKENGGGAFGFINLVGQRLSDSFNYRILPAVRAVGRLFARQPAAKPRSEAKGAQFQTKDCYNCHRDLFTQKASSHLYVNHRLHDAAGLPCGTCHLTTKHPQPKTISETDCQNCHKKQRLTLGCQGCHPPGSVNSKGVIAPAKYDQFFAVRATASLKTLGPKQFGNPNHNWLLGQDNPPCAQCHNVPDFCNRCHLVFHNKEPNWRNVHGPRILQRFYDLQGCFQCHNTGWCATACHPSPTKTRQRRVFDLPKIPLEQFLNR